MGANNIRRLSVATRINSDAESTHDLGQRPMAPHTIPAGPHCHIYLRFGRIPGRDNITTVTKFTPAQQPSGARYSKPNRTNNLLRVLRAFNAWEAERPKRTRQNKTNECPIRKKDCTPPTELVAPWRHSIPKTGH
jgi:hypothetical protein